MPPAELARFTQAARTFWQRNVPCISESSTPAALPWIVVDTQLPDIRITLRHLAIANAIRRVTPARVLVIVGKTDMWRQVFDAYMPMFGDDLERQMAEAFCADAVLDVAAIAEGRLASRANPLKVDSKITVDGIELVEGEGPLLSSARLERIAYATALRVQLLGEISPQARATNEYQGFLDTCTEVAGIYRALFHTLDVMTYITAHHEYDLWAPAVDLALAHQAPVVLTRQKGELQAWTAYPTERSNVVDEHLWTSLFNEQQRSFCAARMLPHAAELAGDVDRVVHNVKFAQTGQFYWRRDAGASIEIRTPQERRDLRPHAARRLGLSPDKPTVGVFAQCFSDAVDLPFPLFNDFADWIRRTASFAAEHDEVNWVFLDHPFQHLYEKTHLFEAISAEYTGSPHIRFMSSKDLGRNLQLSLIDVATTLAGSVSEEFPCYGVPVVVGGLPPGDQSDSALRPDSRDTYFSTLINVAHDVHDGRWVSSRNEVDAFRLWMWHDLVGNTVPTSLLPEYDEVGPHVLKTLAHMESAMARDESGTDPLFSAVERMWANQEPTLIGPVLSAAMSGQGSPTSPQNDAVGYRFRSRFHLVPNVGGGVHYRISHGT